MPELPEVETVCRQLLPLVRGRRLVSLEVFDPKLARVGSPLSNASSRKQCSIIGLRVTDVWRSGKQIVFTFGRSMRRGKMKVDRGCDTLFLVVHLRMTGCLLWNVNRRKKQIAQNLAHPEKIRVPRAEFRFNGGTLEFQDTRRFGTIDIYDNIGHFTPKGRDPVTERLDSAELFSLVKSNRQPLKHFLMRQDRFVGIGNIYASEILFDASLSPFRNTDSLSRAESNRLGRSIQKILNQAIQAAGTTFSDFQDTAGVEGKFQNFLKVYERAGLFCRRCRSAKIQRETQAQRSTYFCPRCQKSSLRPPLSRALRSKARKVT